MMFEFGSLDMQCAVLLVIQSDFVHIPRSLAGLKEAATRPISTLEELSQIKLSRFRLEK